MQQKRDFEPSDLDEITKRAKLEPEGITMDQSSSNSLQRGATQSQMERDTDEALAQVADMASNTANEASTGMKPEHGSDEWHKIRKMNHKEVERRRRETINVAIKELQEMVPTAHNNKAQVIRKAADTIRKMKEQEETNVNKWTLEKIITDQAIAELASSNEKLKIELEKAYREIEYHKSQFGKFIEVVKANGVNPAITEFLNKLQPFPIEKQKNDDDHVENHDNNDIEDNLNQKSKD